MADERKGGLHVCTEVADAIRSMVSSAIETNGRVSSEQVKLIRDFAERDVIIHSRDKYGVLPGLAVTPKQ